MDCPGSNSGIMATRCSSWKYQDWLSGWPHILVMEFTYVWTIYKDMGWSHPRTKWTPMNSRFVKPNLHSILYGMEDGDDEVNKNFLSVIHTFIGLSERLN